MITDLFEQGEMFRYRVYWWWFEQWFWGGINRGWLWVWTKLEWF